MCKLKLKLSAQCNVVPADNNIAVRGVRCRRRRGRSRPFDNQLYPPHYAQLSHDEVKKEASSAAAGSFCQLSQVTERACQASNSFFEEKLGNFCSPTGINMPVGGVQKVRECAQFSNSSLNTVKRQALLQLFPTRHGYVNFPARFVYKSK